jgi:dolichol kinase
LCGCGSRGCAALSLSFWGYFGSFARGLINLSTFYFLPVLWLVLRVFVFGRFGGWCKRKKDNKKNGLPGVWFAVFVLCFYFWLFKIVC